MLEMVFVLNFNSYFYISLSRLGKTHHIYPARWLSLIVQLPSHPIADIGNKMLSKNKQIKKECLGFTLTSNDRNPQITMMLA